MKIVIPVYYAQSDIHILCRPCNVLITSNTEGQKMLFMTLSMLLQHKHTHTMAEMPSADRIGGLSYHNKQ